MKNILITGASGNLGKTILKSFEFESDICVNITSRQEIQQANNLKVFYVDLLNQAEASSLVQELIELYGHIDAVIFLTGGFITGDITVNDSTDIQKMIDVNVATAHNISGLLIALNRNQHKPLQLIYIGAQAAMNTTGAVNNVAYALSKKMLYHYVEIINESENEFGTYASIILPKTINTQFSRELMPHVDVTQWTSPDDIALAIKNIIKGELKETVILL